MESLALLVVLIALVITVFIFALVLFIVIRVQKIKFPHLSKLWYFLIVPLTLLASFGISLLILRILAMQQCNKLKVVSTHMAGFSETALPHEAACYIAADNALPFL